MKRKSWKMALALVTITGMMSATAHAGARPLKPKGKPDVIKSAVYDQDREVMVVEVESDNACNLREAFLNHEKSGRATFGPHIYRLDFGLKTMIGCGQRSTAKLEIPLSKAKADGRLQIHLRNSDSYVIAEGTNKFPRKKMAVTEDSSGSSTSSLGTRAEVTGRN